MFERIYIEKQILHSNVGSEKIERIKARFPNAGIFIIDNYRDVFGKFYKPYLAKRENLWLFLAHKKGELVKPAPAAYGTKSGKHFYFVHAYNCIYECQYCYLQGYFHSPDIVLFLNHDEILSAMEQTINHIHHESFDETVWFHAGEFSDSLALSDLAGELPIFLDFFKRHPKAKLELRTKSVKIQELLKLPPLPNVYISFSLSSERNTREIDLKTPPLKLKLNAIKMLADNGFSLGLHFDPIVYNETFEEDYENLIDQLADTLSKTQLVNQVHYVSIGVVRFTKDVHKTVMKNYPQSAIFTYEMVKSFDQKMRYPRALRFHIMNKVKNLLTSIGIIEERIYLCMEEDKETMDQILLEKEIL